MIHHRVVSARKPNETGHSDPNSQHRKHIGSTTLRDAVLAWALGTLVASALMMVSRALAWVW